MAEFELPRNHEARGEGGAEGAGEGERGATPRSELRGMSYVEGAAALRPPESRGARRWIDEAGRLMGEDFSGLSVVTASRRAQAAGALGISLGGEIHLAHSAEELATSREARVTLAHELVHESQRRKKGGSEAAAEEEAERLAHEVAAGRPARARRAAPGQPLYRKPRRRSRNVLTRGQVRRALRYNRQRHRRKFTVRRFQEGIHRPRTGRFNAGDVQAYARFQKRRGLTVDGMVGPSTGKAMIQHLKGSHGLGAGGLFLTQRERRAAKRYNQRRRLSRSLIKKLQRKIGTSADGIFGPRSLRALVRFQRRRKMVPHGMLTPYTVRVIRKSRVPSRGKRVKGYRNGRPFNLRVVSVGGGESLAVKAAGPYKRMVAAARRAGIYLSNTSGFRTYAEQAALYQRYGAGRAAPPGYSNHQQGLSMDIGGVGSYGTAAYRWLARNARRYGFYDDVPGEHWHWTYKR